MSTLSNVQNVLPEAVERTLRLIEKTKKKIVNLNWSLIFNQTCPNENIWHTYTNSSYICHYTLHKYQTHRFIPLYSYQ